MIPSWMFNARNGLIAFVNPSVLYQSMTGDDPLYINGEGNGLGDEDGNFTETGVIGARDGSSSGNGRSFGQNFYETPLLDGTRGFSAVPHYFNRWSLGRLPIRRF